MQYGTDKNNFNIAEKFDDLYNVNSSVVREVPETNLYEVIVRGVDYNVKEIVGSFYTNKNVDFLIKVHNWLSSPDSINYYSDKSLLNVATMSKNLYLSDIRFFILQSFYLVISNLCEKYNFYPKHLILNQCYIFHRFHKE